MRNNPRRIILFDEIEKADPAVFDIFLQILSDGRLTDNNGRVVSFSESIIMMTTNIGQSFFLDESMNNKQSSELANIELDQKYRPEFLNRFAGRENIVCFHRLEMDSVKKIVRRELTELNANYAQNGISLVYSEETLQAFCEDRYSPKNGARGVQGYIVANVEPLVANLLLEETVTSEVLELVYSKSTRSFSVSSNNDRIRKAS
jgi:ATP-dependent Clp protease ATP-binding subunit ClpB